MKNPDSIIITAPSTLGFLHGIERVSQFCADGYCNVTNAHIIDRPQYVHRGLLLDVGRRYIPISTMYMILDGMSAMHMNRLHWHLTDWVAVRWESKAFPELNSNKRFYKSKKFKIWSSMRLIVVLMFIRSWMFQVTPIVLRARTKQFIAKRVLMMA